MIKKKRTYHQVDFAVLVDHKVKIKENEKIDKYLDLTRELKKVAEHYSDGDGDTNRSWCIWNGPRGAGKNKTGRTENQSKGPTRLYSIDNLLEYFEESWRLTVAQTLVKYHQQTLMWKNSQGVK